jgi:hypothetical protein
MRIRHRLVFGVGLALCAASVASAGDARAQAQCLTDAGGPVLLHPEVSVTFWGSYWTTNPAPTPSAATHLGVIQDVVNSPYLSLLNQYRNPALARMIPAVNFANGSQPPTSLSVATVVTFLTGQMAAGAVPPPPANSAADMVYVVFVPPGSTTGSYHSYGSYNGNRFAFAVVSDGGYPSPGLPFTHELVESITDPYVSAFGGGNSTCEIAGLCVGKSQIQNGHSVSTYWSLVDNKCVVPTSWSGVYEYLPSSNSWTQVGNQSVRQVYAGQLGLVATNTSNALIEFSGFPYNWQSLGGTPGSMYAVGASGVLELANDTSSVAYYNGSTWSTVGGAGSAVYGSSALAATDYGGDLVTFTPSVNAWNVIAGKSDQFVIGGTGIFALAWDHNSVWQYSSGTTWNAIGGAADELFAGGPTTGFLAATTLDQNKYIYIDSSGSTWLPQGGAGYMFAVTGDVGSGKQLFGMTPTRANGAVYRSGDTTSANPPWSYASNGLPQAPGRIIAAPRTIYATVGIDYTTF